MRDMQMDKTELGCLRAIVLFNPGTALLGRPAVPPRPRALAGAATLGGPHTSPLWEEQPRLLLLVALVSVRTWRPLHAVGLGDSCSSSVAWRGLWPSPVGTGTAVWHRRPPEAWAPAEVVFS